VDLQILIDPASAGFVLGGTVLATLVRSGWADGRTAVRQIGNLLRPRFSLARQRAELAAQVAAMQHDGVIRASAQPVSDAEFADATAALVRHRSTAALTEEHRRHAAARQAARATAVDVLSEAGELAPVLGLAGTLLGLSQLPVTGLASDGAVMASVSMAVGTTFHGLVAAHLLFLPLAGVIERRGRREEADRELLAQWLVQQLGPACPRTLAELAA
jgi:chemotaxis protein MotA